MKCLDTDFLVAVLRGQPEAREKMRELDSEGRHATTTVNCFELFYGAFMSREKRSNVERVENLLQRLEILTFELEASRRAGEALATLSAKGEAVDFRDRWSRRWQGRGTCRSSRETGSTSLGSKVSNWNNGNRLPDLPRLLGAGGWMIRNFAS